MFINFGATIFYAVLTFLPLNNGLVAMAVFFGLGESLIHSVFGAAMKKHFSAQGKRTIYGPGSITAYAYFLTIGIAGALHLTKTGFDSACLKTFIFCMFITAGVFIVGLEKLLANPNTEYA